MDRDVCTAVNSTNRCDCPGSRTARTAMIPQSFGKLGPCTIQIAHILSDMAIHLVPAQMASAARQHCSKAIEQGIYIQQHGQQPTGWLCCRISWVMTELHTSSIGAETCLTRWSQHVRARQARMMDSPTPVTLHATDGSALHAQMHKISIVNYSKTST